MFSEYEPSAFFTAGRPHTASVIAATTRAGRVEFPRSSGHLRRQGQSPPWRKKSELLAPSADEFKQRAMQMVRDGARWWAPDGRGRREHGPQAEFVAYRLNGPELLRSP